MQLAYYFDRCLYSGKLFAAVAVAAAAVVAAAAALAGHWPAEEKDRAVQMKGLFSEETWLNSLYQRKKRDIYQSNHRRTTKYLL